MAQVIGFVGCARHVPVGVDRELVIVLLDRARWDRRRNSPAPPACCTRRRRRIGLEPARPAGRSCSCRRTPARDRARSRGPFRNRFEFVDHRGAAPGGVGSRFRIRKLAKLTSRWSSDTEAALPDRAERGLAVAAAPRPDRTPRRTTCFCWPSSRSGARTDHATLARRRARSQPPSTGCTAGGGFFVPVAGWPQPAAGMAGGGVPARVTPENGRDRKDDGEHHGGLQFAAATWGSPLRGRSQPAHRNRAILGCRQDRRRAGDFGSHR